MMHYAIAAPQLTRRAEILIMMLTTSLVGHSNGFAVSHLYSGNYPVLLSRQKKSLSVKYADNDDNDSSTSQIPLAVNDENNRCANNDVSKAVPPPTDISFAIKEILSAPAIPSENDSDGTKQKQRLTTPSNEEKLNELNVPQNPNNNVAKSGKSQKSEETHPKRSLFLLKQRWRRLRPGQKFRFRLLFMSASFLVLWNTIIVRNYNSFITGIITGAAATTTATGFGSILRRWLYNRGFQGIAAFGRSLAYGWAVFVAYPRLLDRRAKERRLKREEDALNQWRQKLKGTADEVLRLRKDLSSLEGEIRAFRREILAIRAARIGDNENNSTSPNQSSSIESDRILRTAIINEMTHLTRLRDETRLALGLARKRWSEVRSKAPIRKSQSALASAVDALDFEVTTELENDSLKTDNSDDPLLIGF